MLTRPTVLLLLALLLGGCAPADATAAVVAALEATADTPSYHTRVTGVRDGDVVLLDEVTVTPDAALYAIGATGPDADDDPPLVIGRFGDTVVVRHASEGPDWMTFDRADVPEAYAPWLASTVYLRDDPLGVASELTVPFEVVSEGEDGTTYRADNGEVGPGRFAMTVVVDERGRVRSVETDVTGVVVTIEVLDDDPAPPARPDR